MRFLRRQEGSKTLCETKKKRKSTVVAALPMRPARAFSVLRIPHRPSELSSAARAVGSTFVPTVHSALDSDCSGAMQQQRGKCRSAWQCQVADDALMQRYLSQAHWDGATVADGMLLLLSDANVSPLHLTSLVYCSLPLCASLPPVTRVHRHSAALPLRWLGN